MYMDTYECRICMEGIESGKLISPCNCKGTVQYIHEHCLTEWRNHSVTPDVCNMCLSMYKDDVILLRTTLKQKCIRMENIFISILFVCINVYCILSIHNGYDDGSLLILLNLMILFSIAARQKNR